MSEPRPRQRSARTGALLTAGLCGLFVLAFYVWLYPVHGYGVAIGSDTPVYVWWARFAGASGIGALGTRSRAVIVALVASLGRVTGTSQAAVAEALAPVLAASLALATGALLLATLGRDRLRFVLGVVLTGSFLSLMVAGYLSTLAFGSMFVAALAALAVGVRTPGWRPIAAGALLLAAAGLSHLLFLGLATAVVGGAVLAMMPASLRAHREGTAILGTAAGRVAAAAMGGALLAGAGFVAVGGGSSVPDTSRDSVLRRAGLEKLLAASYRRKLRHDFPWYRAEAVILAALSPLAGLWTREAPGGGVRARIRAWFERTESQRLLLWGAVFAWLMVTILGVVALFAGRASPGQRLAAFCLPVPILGTIGLARLRPVGRGLLTIAAATAFAVVGWMAWTGQKPLVSPQAVAEARTAGTALAGTPKGTPLILVTESVTDKPGLYVTRWANYVRDGVPGGRVPDVLVFVGTPKDLLAGRPGRTGQREHDAMAERLWREVRPALAHRPLALVFEAFDPAEFPQASALPGSRPLGPGVVALPGFQGSPGRCGVHCGGAYSDPGAGPLSPWMSVWLAPLVLALLGAIGLPWSPVALPGREPLLQIALAPAFGTAALGLSAVVFDTVGLRLSRAGAWAALVLAALGGGLVWAISARGGRRGAP